MKWFRVSVAVREKRENKRYTRKRKKGGKKYQVSEQLILIGGSETVPGKKKGISFEEEQREVTYILDDRKKGWKGGTFS